jgi:hypothetical protein
VKTTRLRSYLGPVVGALVLCLLPRFAAAQAIIKVNDTTSFRLGILLQGWGDWLQDATTSGYAQNLFLRRARFLVGGQLTKDVSFFFVTDNANLGKAPKSLATGFITQDAFVEWKVANEFILDGGLILVPFCRNCLQSAASLLTIDYGTWTFNNSGPTQSSAGRDTGFQAKGYLVEDHLEYRVGAFQGFRETGSRNSFRTVGRVQYNFFDTEKGPFYTGTYLGKKKILAVGGGFDKQQDYEGYAADLFLDLPVAKGDGITFQADFLHFDGRTTFPTPAPTGKTALPLQNDIMGEVGYYLSSAKVQPFFRYEQQRFVDASQVVNDKNKYMFGLNWYIAGQNLKLTPAYIRLENPKTPNPITGAGINQFTIQLQAFYY